MQYQSKPTFPSQKRGTFPQPQNLPQFLQDAGVFIKCFNCNSKPATMKCFNCKSRYPGEPYAKFCYTCDNKIHEAFG